MFKCSFLLGYSWCATIVLPHSLTAALCSQKSAYFRKGSFRKRCCLLSHSTALALPSSVRPVACRLYAHLPLCVKQFLSIFYFSYVIIPGVNSLCVLLSLIFFSKMIFIYIQQFLLSCSSFQIPLFSNYLTCICNSKVCFPFIDFVFVIDFISFTILGYRLYQL